MKTGEFIKRASNALGIGEPTTKQFVRTLKDAPSPFFSVGLRGRYSPDVTILDAVHLIVAVLGTDRPTQAAEALEAFKGITLDNDPACSPLPPQLAEMEYPPTIVEFMEGILCSELYSIKIRQVQFQIEDRTAEVTLMGYSDPPRLRFSQGYASGIEATHVENAKLELNTIRTARAILGSQLLEIGLALKLD